MKAAGRLETGPGSPVEVLDVRTPPGEHDDVFAGKAGAPPVGNEPGADVLGVVAERDPAVVAVGADGGVDVAVAQLAQCLTLPFVPLAAVLGELDAWQPVSQPGQQASGVDLGKLARVADQHDLGSRVSAAWSRS